MMQDEGQKFAQELAQQFAANRAVESIERMNAEVAEEEVGEEEEIRLKIRRWK